MSLLFLKLLNMSIAASGLILAVILVRLCLKNTPRWIICLLWAFVALRLICPFSIQSIWSRIPASIGNGSLLADWSNGYVGGTSLIHESSPDYEKALSAGLTPTRHEDGSHYIVAGADRQTPPSTVADTVLPVLASVWSAGVLLMLLYTAVSYLRLYRRVSESILLYPADNIYLCDAVKSPFILGILRPRILLPSEMADASRELVIAHEQSHLRRLDHLWKPLGFLILTIHWFNPLCWLSYALFCRDIELACDERVIRRMDISQRKAYASALLDLSTPHRCITVCPLAFGEIGAGERIKNILTYKKPTVWVIFAAVIVCAFVGVSFLTNPKPGNAAPTAPAPGTSSYEAVLLPDSLDQAVSEAVLSYNNGKYLSGDFACESHIILATEEKTTPRQTEVRTVSVYAVVLYEEFAYAGAGFGEMSGGLTPVSLTFDVADGGKYVLTEYREPRDGTHYAEDIKANFPENIAKELNTQKYVLALKQACYAQAVEHGDVDTDFVIERFLDTIISSPSASSNPHDYIAAHDDVFRELTYFGDYTLRYCFGEFLKGGQTDLRGHVMRALIDTLAPELALNLAANTGQEYFDAVRQAAERTYLANGEEWMKENMPQGWILIRMMQEK